MADDISDKFYILTEALKNALNRNDLAAEFPFDISSTEFEIIQHYKTASLIFGRSGTGKTTCLLFKLASNYLARIVSEDLRPARQVLLTRSSLLADKLREHAQRLIEGQQKCQVKLYALGENENEDEDDRATTYFGERHVSENILHLNASHFPLVCTFVQFLQVCENSMSILDRQNFTPFVRRDEHFITLQEFSADYWPSFPSLLRKHLSPSQVFPEILGIIKGSRTACATFDALSRADYTALPTRAAPTFRLESQRHQVYDIFLRYEQMKKDRNASDVVDRVLRIMVAINKSSHLRAALSNTFDEIYIDEVQDLQSVDLALFLSFIRDPRGVFCCGDTAQAISQDSVFSFQATKDLFYQRFASGGEIKVHRDAARPTLFTLSKNYRSHQGILALASFFMGMLCDHYSDAVDKLPPEVGRMVGPIPIAFLDTDFQAILSASSENVQFSKRAADFGSEQVILVRDNEAKVALEKEIGDAALVLTILQAKGMEFDDVVLWNFFDGESASAAKVARRLAMLYKEDPKSPTIQDNWDLCAELKLLYVAVTRARFHLFLVESSAKSFEPVKDVLVHGADSPLIEVTRPGNPSFFQSVMSMLPGETQDLDGWKRRGHHMMQTGNYAEAALCFRKGGDNQNKNLALGIKHEFEARRAINGKDPIAEECIGLAVKRYKKAKAYQSASDFLERIRYYHQAARIWLDLERLDKAAPLFGKAKLWKKAAITYRVLGEFEKAYSSYSEGKEYNALIEFLRISADQLKDNTLHKTALLCKFLLKKNKLDPSRKPLAIALLGNSD